MQQNQYKTTASLRNESRIKNARTPDKPELRQLNTSTSSISSPKAKVNASRIRSASISSNIFNATLRKLEAENYNLDLELAYSDYVASHNELILENNAAEEAEKEYKNVITNICDETNPLHEKFNLIKTRILDVKTGSYLTDYQDNVNQWIKTIEKDIESCEIRDTLSKLINLLNRFNILRCENITLPAHEEEMQEFKKELTNCFDVMQNFSDFEKAKVIEKQIEHRKSFTMTLEELRSLKNIIEEEIFNVQSKTLQTCSNILAYGDQ